MFFTLSKILSVFFSPLTWILVALLMGLFLKDRQKKKRWMIAGLVLLFFFTNPLLRQVVFAIWEVPVAQPDKIEKHDMAIVLGGAMRYYNTDISRPVYSPAVERLIQAVMLYRKGKVSTIFLSGGSGLLFMPQFKESEILSRELHNLCVDEKDIFMENESRNTYENAVYTAQALREMNFGGSLLLITSAHHMRRSLACFEKAGIKVTPYAVDSYAGKIIWRPDRILIPDAENLWNWDMLIHEWIGCIAYKLKGYI
jgi:uncharacterized SAM-binding protein YcdF (DUF218 family)